MHLKSFVVCVAAGRWKGMHFKYLLIHWVTWDGMMFVVFMFKTEMGLDKVKSRVFCSTVWKLEMFEPVRGLRLIKILGTAILCDKLWFCTNISEQGRIYCKSCCFKTLGLYVDWLNNTVKMNVCGNTRLDKYSAYTP